MPHTIPIKARCPKCGNLASEVHLLTRTCMDCTSDMTVREINRRTRKWDESHKYPINGKFNATERAIRNLRKQARESGEANHGGYEYAMALDMEISRIVNSEV